MKFKVAGKFYLICLDTGRIIDDEVFINKIVEAEIQRQAMELAVDFILKKFTKKYHYYEYDNLELRQKSDVLVKFYKNK
ncbi:MAG: hypothetical protein PF549_04905 [Patescibacteria group bacterium]|jgi:hypothetical protein|nr:hypothetical protein [Patescibacteria group bacterium]